MIKPGAIGTRKLLGHLLNSMGLVNVGVEVGVYRGEYAVQILEHWHGEYHGVDPWIDLPEYASQKLFLEHIGLTSNREDDYQETLRVLEPYSHRAKLHKATSETAANYFADGSLDWVYVDGNHEEPFVSQDLELWYPKLRVGGILAGHDVCCAEEDGGWAKYIQPAAMRFCEKHHHDLYLVPEEPTLPWSFYIIKNSG